jgi:hypothetical protein
LNGWCLHLDTLGVVSEIAVLRVGLRAASVAYGGADNTRKAAEHRLRPPEASQREHRRGRCPSARQRRSDCAAAGREPRSRCPRNEEDEHRYHGRRGGGGGCHHGGRSCRGGGSTGDRDREDGVTNRRVGWLVALVGAGLFEERRRQPFGPCGLNNLIGHNWARMFIPITALYYGQISVNFSSFCIPSRSGVLNANNLTVSHLH